MNVSEKIEEIMLSPDNKLAQERELFIERIRKINNKFGRPKYTLPPADTIGNTIYKLLNKQNER